MFFLLKFDYNKPAAIREPKKWPLNCNKKSSEFFKLILWIRNVFYAPILIFWNLFLKVTTELFQNWMLKKKFNCFFFVVFFVAFPHEGRLHPKRWMTGNSPNLELLACSPKYSCSTRKAQTKPQVHRYRSRTIYVTLVSTPLSTRPQWCNALKSSSGIGLVKDFILHCPSHIDCGENISTHYRTRGQMLLRIRKSYQNITPMSHHKGAQISHHKGEPISHHKVALILHSKGAPRRFHTPEGAPISHPKARRFARTCLGSETLCRRFLFLLHFWLCK